MLIVKEILDSGMKKQDLLLIAGDIAGSYDREIKWLQGIM